MAGPRFSDCQMAALIRRSRHRSGGGLEWRQVHDNGVVHVSVIPSARGALLRVGGEYKWRLVVLAATMVPFGAIAGWLLGTALFAGEPTVIAIGLAVVGAAAGVSGVRGVRRQALPDQALFRRGKLRGPVGMQDPKPSWRAPCRGGSAMRRTPSGYRGLVLEAR